MKMFRTGSPAVVAECQVQFNFLPLRYQIDIRTVKFLSKYVTLTNSICAQLQSQARNSMENILTSYSVSTVFDFYCKIDDLFRGQVQQ